MATLATLCLLSTREWSGMGCLRRYRPPPYRAVIIRRAVTAQVETISAVKLRQMTLHLHHTIHCALFCSLFLACSIIFTVNRSYQHGTRFTRSLQHPYAWSTQARLPSPGGELTASRSITTASSIDPRNNNNHHHSYTARSALANAALHEHIDIHQALGLFSCA